MGRRRRQIKSKPIQIIFAFMRTSNFNQSSPASRLQRSFLIDQQQEQNKQLQYPIIQHCLQEFLKQKKLTREVKITYLDEDKQNHQITSKFSIEYKTIRECYNSEFVIMVQTKIDYCSQKLQRIVIELNELTKEVQEITRDTEEDRL